MLHSSIVGKIWRAGFEDGFAGCVARTVGLSRQERAVYFTGFHTGCKARRDAKPS